MRSLEAMSDTPRTDAVASDSWSGDAVCVPVEFSRILERELNRRHNAHERMMRVLLLGLNTRLDSLMCLMATHFLNQGFSERDEITEAMPYSQVERIDESTKALKDIISLVKADRQLLEETLRHFENL